ncbi:class I SAM-dependent methyltransferase [Pseudonocardia broussonetiae]|uniref:Class I SAM-dependent methyltransferase n=1 Tax=Pseudonocardia broussonetiae TaxID=2736640 RepID=A0A6M6JQ79_9PSEU|nr:class I SAM-dependent methyltransferase [Pseudonocardia broussonetiae]QJY48579.1 class I SAM-dependent methyltransferase [Pseudonocardia broussonetiae]
MTFVRTPADLLTLLDDLLTGQDGARWDAFFADRARPCPFLVDLPDENLAGWVEQGVLAPGRALELGCGHGRNAVHLARHGWRVDAVDFSATALDRARESAAAAGVDVTLHHGSVLDLRPDEGGYDLVYDSGCFHHVAPHRRPQFVDVVRRALAPGGRFGLVCFSPEGGSGLTDREVYERRTLGGGLGYSEDQLRALWSDGFVVDELRPLRAGVPGRFGEEFLNALLATRVTPG